MNANERIYVIGDVHGQFEKLARLLRDTKLVGNTLSWTGGSAILWFMGDFFDRGPDGIEVVDMVMRLQSEATAAGGRVESLLGNHEVVLLAARRFGTRATTGPGGNFVADWEYNGGCDTDLARITLQASWTGSSTYQRWRLSATGCLCMPMRCFTRTTAPRLQR